MSDQPAVPFFDALHEHKAHQRQALRETMTGHRSSSSTRPSDVVPSFDGGARKSPSPPPPSHEETLLEIIRASRAGA